MGIEYELKYSATAEVQARLQQSLDCSWSRTAMRTTYYDTPGGTLSARKWTLRHRLENERHVCTLKTPADGAARCEWEVEAPAIGEAIGLLCAAGAPAELARLTAGGLTEVCGASFTRQAGTVTFGDTVLEVALDRGTLFSGDHTAPLCEVEVELKRGSRSDADTFAGILAHRFGLQRLYMSKFKRALALRSDREAGSAAP